MGCKLWVLPCPGCMQLETEGGCCLGKELMLPCCSLYAAFGGCRAAPAAFWVHAVRALSDADADSLWLSMLTTDSAMTRLKAA